MKFSHQWELQCENAMLNIVDSSIKFWSLFFFFFVTLYQYFDDLIMSYVFCQFAVNWAFSFENYLYMSLPSHILMRKQDYLAGRCTNSALSSFQAFSAEEFCGLSLKAHLIWSKISDLYLKFYTYIIIYKNSSSTECIHPHIDVYIYVCIMHM